MNENQSELLIFKHKKKTSKEIEKKLKNSRRSRYCNTEFLFSFFFYLHESAGFMVER